MNKIEKLQNIIENSKYIVFFGGAGISTESGIPDFRSGDGLFNQDYKLKPEEILSHTFFLNHPKAFFEYYFNNMVYENALPNECHKKLVELESRGKLKAIITQNIDGLHEQAGSKNIYNLHGTIYKNYCTNCGKEYSLNDIKKEIIPKCKCGGIIKPDVVLYEEQLDSETLNSAIKHISRSDTLIVGGTSLKVYPAAGLINYFNGQNLVVINKEDIDIKATLFINDSVAKVFKSIK